MSNSMRLSNHQQLLTHKQRLTISVRSDEFPFVEHNTRNRMLVDQHKEQDISFDDIDHKQKHHID